MSKLLDEVAKRVDPLAFSAPPRTERDRFHQSNARHAAADILKLVQRSSEAMIAEAIAEYAQHSAARPKPTGHLRVIDVGER